MVFVFLFLLIPAGAVIAVFAPSEVRGFFLIPFYLFASAFMGFYGLARVITGVRDLFEPDWSYGSLSSHFIVGGLFCVGAFAYGWQLVSVLAGK
jgi:hypothetical protein